MILEQIDKRLLEMAKQADTDLREVFERIDETCMVTSDRVLSAFIENRVSYTDFADINGCSGKTADNERYQCPVSGVLRFTETRRYHDFPYGRTI